MLLVFLGALIVAIPVCWVAGIAAALLLGSPFGFDIDGYQEPEHAHLSDHIQLIWVGFVILAGGFWAWTVFFAFIEEWSNWAQAKRKLKVERAADRERRES